MGSAKRNRGFTLIEVLTTILVFGILVSITSYVYGISLQRSRDTQRLTDLGTIKNTLEQYYLENRTYPYNSYYRLGNDSRPRVAKFELERYILGDCDNGLDDPTKAANNNSGFLAPTYITTLPEDPRHPMLLEADGVGECRLRAVAGQVDGYGQYLYASLVNDPTDQPRSYYLMARLERPTHVSASIPTIEQRYSFSIDQIDFSNSGTGWDYNYCAGEQSNDAGCSYNYYLKNSNND